MHIFEDLLLKDSIEIKVKPEKIWEFFSKLEENYKSWHPEDHLTFQWTHGEPLEENSTCYAEQYVFGKIQKYHGTCVKIVPNRKIVIKFAFPVSIVSPKIEWLIEPKGSHSIFTAITFMRFGKLYQKLFKRRMKNLIEAHDKHVMKEGENLKRLLEI